MCIDMNTTATQNWIMLVSLLVTMGTTIFLQVKSNNNTQKEFLDKQLQEIQRLSFYDPFVENQKETIMNREELIAEISKSAKVTKKEASEVLSATIDTIQSAVKKGEKVTLVGFGTFESRRRAARVGRNPQTGKELKIAAKTVPAFSAGKKFKELVK